MNSEATHGACAVCGTSVRHKCSICKQKFYCSKDHQQQDWPQHKIECQAWEIAENAELGRHLLAKRDINAGDLLILEPPLVWGPALHSDQRLCVGCGQACTSRDTRCGKCQWPACSTTCAGLDDKNRHRLECSFLQKAQIVPRCDVLLVIRMLILWHTKSKRWSSLEKLLSHEEARGPGTEAYNEVMEIMHHLQRFLSINPASADMLPKICGLIDVNALETMPPEGCMAIYETACLLEHSCLPNTRHVFSMDEKGKPRISVYALCPIKKGEHISTMYTHALWATRARRAHLLDTKYFSCHCKRCSDATELGTHLGTLKCPQDDGLILPKDPLDINSNWQCDSCAGILSADEVTDLTLRLEDEVEDAMADAKMDGLVELLSRLTKLLHPGHQQCITVSHSLIQMLGRSDPQKALLCKRVIETTKTLDPYGARLAVYTAVALRELANCPGEDRKALLQEAVALLANEPLDSPGERLKCVTEGLLLYMTPLR